MKKKDYICNHPYPGCKHLGNKHLVCKHLECEQMLGRPFCYKYNEDLRAEVIEGLKMTYHCEIIPCPQCEGMVEQV